jgi:dTDP-4-amino-4,6-dideoxygalactose transaminase/predicted dehydrogenase
MARITQINAAENSCDVRQVFVGRRPVVAVVGLGAWGSRHVATLMDLIGPGRVIGVDRDPQRRAWARARGIRAVSGVDRLPRGLDGAVVATPTPSHYEVASALLELDLPLLIEKPLTTDLDAATELVRAADKRSLPLLVGHVFLFQSAHERLRDYVGTMGRVRAVWSERRTPGLVKPESSAWLELAPHELAAAIDVGALAKRVLRVSVSDWSVTGVGGHDGAAACFSTPDCEVKLDCTWLSAVRRRRFWVVAEEGQVLLDDDGEHQELSRWIGDQRWVASRPAACEHERVAGEPPLRRELRAFLESIESGVCTRSDGSLGQRVVELLERVHRCRDGRQFVSEEKAAATPDDESVVRVHRGRDAAIPLVDLAIQHREIEGEVRAGFDAVMNSGEFVLGPAAEEFERVYAKFCGVRHCIGVANGTDALELSVRALGLGRGDEIILPANTFIASALAVVRAGAEPVLVDSDPDYHQIDVSQIAARIGPRTRAILAVDLFGQLPRYEELEELARDAGLALIEDAAQSHGARRGNRVAGAFGAIAGTSFFPGKNLGAYGDAGAITTDRDDLAERVRRLRNYGSDRKYHHPELGFNSRLDSLQAVVVRAKLERLPAWNESRRLAAQRYHELLSDLDGVALPGTRGRNEHVWHIYAVRVPFRDRVLAQLHALRIGAGVHYPVPIHLQGAFTRLGRGPGSFPVAERAAAEMISLPIYPGISIEQQVAVVDALRNALASRKAR